MKERLVLSFNPACSSQCHSVPPCDPRLTSALDHQCSNYVTCKEAEKASQFSHQQSVNAGCCFTLAGIHLLTHMMNLNGLHVDDTTSCCSYYHLFPAGSLTFKSTFRGFFFQLIASLETLLPQPRHNIQSAANYE